MRYAKLSCTEFNSRYLKRCLSIDLFSYRLWPERFYEWKILWRSVHPPIWRFLGIGPLVFSRTQHGLGAHVVLCMTARFFENILPPKWPSRGFLDVFSIWSTMFIINSIWSIIIAVCLNKSHILGHSGFWDMGQKCSWPIRLH